MAARFDIENLRTRTNLVLSVDNETYERYRDNEQPARFLRALRKARVLGVDEAQQQDTTTLTLRSSSLMRFRNAADAAVVVLDDMYNLVDADPMIPRMMMSHETIGDSGRRGMMAAVRWPRADERSSAVFATRHMQRFASSVDLLGNPRLNTANDMVYVVADRSRGMRVETNPLGSCNISAGGDGYDPEQPIVELFQHNIYSSSQQLACLMGAVSFATADLHVDR